MQEPLRLAREGEGVGVGSACQVSHQSAEQKHRKGEAKACSTGFRPLQGQPHRCNPPESQSNLLSFKGAHSGTSDSNGRLLTM